jgi:hypothetical protein
MFNPILPGAIDAQVRQRQRELEQQAQLNEQVRLAVDAGSARRGQAAASVVRGFLNLASRIAGLASRSGAGARSQGELEIGV